VDCTAREFIIKQGNATIQVSIYDSCVNSPTIKKVSKQIESIEAEIKEAMRPIYKEYHFLMNQISYKKIDDELLERIERFMIMFDD
jgi:hypothetical protein